MRMYRGYLLIEVVLLCITLAVNAVFIAKRVRIGVDYGPRLIGLAYSDYFGLVKPYLTIPNNGNLISISKEVLLWAKSIRAAELIVGVPVGSNGRLDYNVKTINGKICLNFATVLASEATNETDFHPIVRLFDERFTTKEAKHKLSSSRIRASTDAVAAACLLERYLEEKGKGSMDAAICPYPPPPEIANFDYDWIRQYIKSEYYEAVEGFDVNEFKVWKPKHTPPLDPGDDQPTQIIPVISTAEADAEIAAMRAIRDARRKKGTLKKNPLA